MGFHPLRWVSVFGDLRYYKSHITWNVGAKGYIFHPDELEGLRPYLKAMFGVSQVVQVADLDSLNGMFLGPTAGIGTEFRFGEYRKRAVSIAVNVMPYKSQKYNDRVAQVKATPQGYQEGIPVMFEFGYHHTF